MADKPARALVIYGDGLMPLVSPAHSHIHKLASLGSCGFLALRDASHGENEDLRVARKLSQLLDVPYSYNSGEPHHADASTIFQTPKISERFMGMRAAMCAGCPLAKSFGRDVGFTIMNIDDLMKRNVTSEQVDQAICSVIAAELLKWLGFQDGKVMETSEYDLVFVHVKSSTDGGGDLEFLNALVGDIVQVGQSAPQISSRLHISLILSYGAVSETENGSSLTTNLLRENSDLSSLYPNQSYTTKEGKILNDISDHHPMLIAQWQEAVTRKDRAQTFEFEEFQKHGGSLAILAERFIHEIAFKLWKAPKYGA